MFTIKVSVIVLGIGLVVVVELLGEGVHRRQCDFSWPVYRCVPLRVGCVSMDESRPLAFEGRGAWCADGEGGMGVLEGGAGALGWRRCGRKISAGRKREKEKWVGGEEERKRGRRSDGCGCMCGLLAGKAREGG